MIASIKKEVYIPIEIKPREFVSQLLLSGELAKIGLRVYLGSKKSIDILMENKNNKTGAYLYKGGGGSINKFKDLSKQVKSIAVLDQEISPNLSNYDISINNRFVKGCLKYVSRLYYIGPKAQKTAKKVLDDIDPINIQAFGWPRVDLWDPSLHHIWNDQIKKIKKRFPEPFILFSSNFGCNTIELLEKRSISVEKRGKKKTKKEVAYWRRNLEKNFKNYNEFISFLKLLDSDPDIPQIIIRPHPGENHSQWEEDTKNMSDIHIVYESDVNPWLLASQGLLHRGCTTALEAAVSGKKLASLVNFSLDTNLISIKISKKIKDLKTLKEWIKQGNPVPVQESEFYGLLEEHITFANKNAAYKIAKDLSCISGEAVQPSHDFKKVFNIKKALKLFFTKVKNKIYKKPNYLPKLPKTNKMQNGISLSECKYFLSLMHPKIKYNFEEPFDNLVRIET